MASFLVTQLLQTAMLEAAKDKSKMSEADALALLETLQKMSETKTAQDKSSATWNAADEAVENKFPSEKSSSSETTWIEKPVQVGNDSVLKDQTDIPLNVATAQDDTATMDENEKLNLSLLSDEDVPLTVPPSMPSKKDGSVLQANTEKFQRSLLVARIRNDAPIKTATNEIEVDIGSSSVPAPRPDDDQFSTMPQIPDAISMEFGKPLEVATADVPALRESSIPRRTPECKFVPPVEEESSQNIPNDLLSPKKSLKSITKEMLEKMGLRKLM